MTRRRPEDPPEAFNVRRARIIRDIHRTQWSRIHCLSCLSWWSHLERHPDSWPAILSRTQGFEWVAQHRLVWNSPSSQSSKTNTRSARGRVIRWDQIGWTIKLDPQGSRDKKLLWELSGKLLGLINIRMLVP